MISNRCARKSLVTNCNSIISKNYLRFLVDSNASRKNKHEVIYYQDTTQRDGKIDLSLGLEDS